MQAHGLYEGSTGIINKTRHVEQKIEEINADRAKRGQRPMTKQQCVGDGVNAGKIRKVFTIGGWKR